MPPEKMGPLVSSSPSSVQMYTPSSQLVADLLKINPPPMPSDGQQQFQLPDYLVSFDWPFDSTETFDFFSEVQV